MIPIRFTIVGVAEPKGSAKNVPLVRKFPTTIYSFAQLLKSVAITSDNPKVRRWQKYVAEAATRSLGGVHLELEGAFEVEAIYYFPIPVSYPKSFDGQHVVRPDGDKCLRAICDALKGIVFRDDAQITDHISRKRYAPRGTSPRVDVTITPIAIGLPLFPEAAVAGRQRQRDKPVTASAGVPW